MGPFILIGAMVLVFLTMGGVLLSGRGSFLIAGYNTATPEERAQYDEKKICRAVGVLCMIIAVMLVFMGYFGYRVDTGLMEENKMLTFAIVFIAITLTSVAVVMIYTNKACKVKNKSL
jgi:hypothetical protein